ncbi:O-antigen ligase like membrane protein [Devosia enhydra]|uniref:O-antigen ligase like membrane protein n=1 Tax=Devosia enhydra TaxID=665118 RepID=A0A1K2HUZ8_9HYPH|nr:O-antigen ligase family protein [Devosia enhydra]SFZ82237.1 O-antigen ligase like membrane protein [Devosia enhydra]
MTTDIGTFASRPRDGISLGALRFTLFSLRNLIFFTAVLAMNYTLMRPSPVDLLYITSFIFTFLYMVSMQKLAVTPRTLIFSMILAAWAISFLVASLPHLSQAFVTFELLAKTFAISIGFIAAFVSMTWTRRHFETFMAVYIASCVIAAILGTIGFLTQLELLTWDGRAKGLIDDPNMYGSFLIPAIVFCSYFLSRGQGSKIVLGGAIAVVMLGILLSFSRIGVVAAVFCLLTYIVFHNRRHPGRLVLIVAGLAVTGVIIFIFASLTSAEFMDKLLDRLTFAKSYDLGEEGRYRRYLLVLPMILQDPIGLGVLQLEKIFPEPIHNIWLSSFVNYGWGGGFSYITLAVGSVVVSILNYRRTRSELAIALLLSLAGIIFCSSLHEGEHWRHSWLFYGLVWGFNASLMMPAAKPAAAPKAPIRSASPPDLRAAALAELRGRIRR